MKIEKRIVIGASSEKVWDTLGPQYADVGTWASAVYESKPLTDQPVIGDAPVCGRVCETSLGPFRETIVEYDSEKMRLAYQATGKKMPFFVKRLQGNWRLRSLTPGKTEVNMSLEADIMAPFNVLMGWMMKMQFNKVLNESLEELKFFNEHGRIHQRKLALNQKVLAT